MKRKNTMDMTTGPLMGKVLFFSLPIMLSSILQLLFNTADTIVVGRFAGKEALAAVGSVGSLNNLIIGLFVGLSVGANVLVARYTGSKDDRNVVETVHTSVLLSLVGGALLSFVGFFLARPLLLMMGSPDDVIDLSVLYVRIIFVALPVQMLYNFCAAILRAVGDTKRPLYYLTFAGVVNVLLNLVFVILLHMSVAGVALATIISQAISAALITNCLMRMEGPTRLVPRQLRFNLGILGQIVRIGLPAGVQSSVFSLSNVVIQSSVNSFGSIVIAGNAAAASISNFVWQAMNSFQQAITCFASQNMGARKPRRVIASLWVCLIWANIFGIVLSSFCCIFGVQLLHLFNTDPEVISAGLIRIYYLCGTYFTCGSMDTMTGVLRGIGYSFLPMVVSILGACVFRILWVMTVFAAFHTMDVLLLSYPISWTLTLAVLIVIFIRLWKSILLSFTPEERMAD